MRNTLTLAAAVVAALITTSAHPQTPTPNTGAAELEAQRKAAAENPQRDMLGAPTPAPKIAGEKVNPPPSAIPDPPAAGVANPPANAATLTPPEPSKAPATAQGDAAPTLPPPPPPPPVAEKTPSAPAPVAEEGACVRVFLNVADITEPGKFWMTIHDRQDDLVAKLEKCNDKRFVQPLAPGRSTRSAWVYVTQGADGWATVKVPADRKPELLARMHSSDPRLAKHPFWQSAPFGDKSEIKLTPSTPGEVVGKKDPI